MMVDQERSYILLARAEAALGAVVALGIFATYFLRPNSFASFDVSFAAAIIGAAVAIYYATLHQVLGRRWPQWSTIALSILALSAIALVIDQTGRLDSPFYAFWLLAIVTAGMFGLVATMTVLGGTIVLYLIDLITHPSAHYFADHVVEFGLTLLAGAIAEWIHSRSRTARAIQGERVAALSGKLSAEAFKTNALITSIGEGVVVIDNERHVQLFNKAAQTLTGWDEKSAQGLDYSLILKLQDTGEAAVPPENDPFSKAMATHAQVVESGLTITTQGGRKIAAELSVSPIYDDKSRVTGAIGLFRDITEQKAIERQRDEFVSTASHEMRTPVAAIEGYLSLAMNPNVALIDDRAKGYLTKAHDAVQHLGELFRDLLSVTKAEEGKLQGKSEAVNLTELVKTAVDDMQFTAQKKNLSLVFQASSGGDVKAIAPLYYVKANPERLREVVMNLIDNAVKFTSQGGITVTLTGGDKEATVAVADTGIGIAPEDAAHLFQKFYRIDSSATRTIGGTGLGLYLCRTVIELFGGRIWVDGAVGKGSTFSFLLPRLNSAEVAKLQAETVASQAAETQSAIPTSTAAAVSAVRAVVSTPPATSSPTAANEPQSAMAQTNPALTRDPAATIAAALAAHPPKGV